MPPHQHLERIENTDRDVVAFLANYPGDQMVEIHSHRRIQLLYVKTGTLQLETRFGAWVVPPGFAVWIPHDVLHQLRMLNATTHNLYFRKETVAKPLEKCQVIEVSPLLKELISAAISVPPLYDQDARDGQLMKMLVQEAVMQPVVPLHLPMPRDEQLARLCQAFFKAPTQASGRSTGPGSCMSASAPSIAASWRAPASLSSIGASRLAPSPPWRGCRWATA
jgi:mannose-6-phosphate isomerase-like protein (cupin superfamily)